MAHTQGNNQNNDEGRGRQGSSMSEQGGTQQGGSQGESRSDNNQGGGRSSSDSDNRSSNSDSNDSDGRGRQGFASMDKDQQREIASKGGQSQGKENNPGNFANDPKRAAEAGRKGGRS